MNCANHPDLVVSAYCQNCGKPLCTQCVRPVAGVVYCEPCLAARLHPGSGYGGGTFAGTAGPTARAGAPASPAAWVQVPGAPTSGAPSPVLAGFLGLIPGVGAMYNGQFVKAFAHVIVFVILVSITEHLDSAGILVAAWVFYQVFDAVQTAVARRDGTPLPDPFGLNDLGQRLGMPPAVYTPPQTGPGAGAGSAEWTGQPVPGAVSGAATAFAPDAGIPSAGAGPRADAYAPEAGAAHSGAAAAAPFPPTAYPPGAPAPYAPYVGRSEPIGAIVLIGVGVLFLLSTLGVFRLDWIGRGWPVLIILVGAGLLFSRVRANRRAGGAL